MIKMTRTENGLVRGIPAADPRIIAYKGVPFAAPPVGNLRWKAPQPATNWAGVRDCIEFAPISMQNKPGENKEDIYSREWNVDPEIPMSEDCLYLNIWTPAESENDRLPVFVWYFGGGLQVGNTAEMEFDGERIASRGIVVVTINYRVNLFGFLTHPEIIKESPEAPANFGNLDQQFGLMWTKRNIAAFGGDPDNITIGGQSAGAGSVMTQLTCPANKPYIQKAIIDSGMMLNLYPPFRPRLTLEEAAKQGEEFFEELGVKTLAEARAIPAEVLRDKNLQGRRFWGTVADGIFQTDIAINNILKGELLDVPILMGHTRDEFFARPRVESIEDLKALAKETFGDKADSFMALIDTNDGLEKALENASVSGIEYAIRVVCRKLNALGIKGPHYVYDFGPEIPGWDDPGSFHSSDLWFWFETLAKCWRPFVGKHYDLARQMCNYWANFIRSGDPNGNDADGTPMEKWEPFTDVNPVYMTFYEAPKSEVRPAKGIMKYLVDNHS
ncbi:MAG: carboxylesterase/lipase family protein [Clostridiales bacterium]|nr:carboxylesterase/lipase family protein [Clostridiales bacterium]